MFSSVTSFPMVTKRFDRLADSDLSKGTSPKPPPPGNKVLLRDRGG